VKTWFEFCSGWLKTSVTAIVMYFGNRLAVPN